MKDAELLAFISNHDPQNLLDMEVKEVEPKYKANTSENAIEKAFQEINAFYEKHNRLPQRCNNRNERNLSIHFKRMMDNENIKESLKPCDIHHLFTQKKEYDSIADILKDPKASRLLDMDNDESGLFSFTNGVKTAKERAEADFIAHRKKCKDFNRYKTMFESVQKAIEAKHRKLIEFSERNLHVGGFYVMKGIIFYLESVDNLVVKGKGYDGRTHCIFSNGTESNIYYQTVVKNLTAGKGQSITEDDRSEAGLLFDQRKITINQDDQEAGYIYVLKSYSQNEKIKDIPDLYKIGFTTQSVESRIANATKEATYLYSEVRLVASWKCYNTKTAKVENIIHRFFKPAQKVFSVINSKKQNDATEWFAVPLPLIKEAVERIVDGSIVHYYYDKDTQTIKKK